MNSYEIKQEARRERLSSRAKRLRAAAQRLAQHVIGLIEPHYPKGENGHPPKPLAVMLRIYFMQQWFNLSDPQAENGLYDGESMRRFAGLELADDALPDETTICKFRHLLERHQLTGAIYLPNRQIARGARVGPKSP